MARRYRRPRKTVPQTTCGTGDGYVLPVLATAKQLARVLQVSPRCIHLWAEKGLIPRAIHNTRGTVRFHTASVAAALGLDLPEFGLTEPLDPKSA
ncbi:MAG: MerR family transcriptional regulator [Verrucomicrobiae bacterium]|nr:MerR family transcriptional regulator [Verrucomicrobiae bacterium]